MVEPTPVQREAIESLRADPPALVGCEDQGIAHVSLDWSMAFDDDGRVRAKLDTHLGRGVVDVPIYWDEVMEVASTAAEIREEIGGDLGWLILEAFATDGFRPGA